MKVLSAYTAVAYRELLELLKERRYEFGDYRDGRGREGERIVYLRHDIDYSPGWALSLARINAEAGATATFFFQLRSPNYNLHSYTTIAAIRQICTLGQRVGLHFSLDGNPPRSNAELADCIAADYKAMQTQIADVIPVFSWHNPSVLPEVLPRAPEVQVHGLVNTYARQFVGQIKYYSESNMRYSLAELRAIIQSGERRFQLLIHPFQWVAGGRDMQEVLAQTWIQVIREKEREFLTNHIYRQQFPDGMSQEWLDQLAARIGTHRGN